VQDPPVAIKDQVVTTRNTEVVISPLSNDYDPDGDHILLNGFFQPANGTAQDLGDGRVLYTPKATGLVLTPSSTSSQMETVILLLAPLT